MYTVLHFFFSTNIYWQSSDTVSSVGIKRREESTKETDNPSRNVKRQMEKEKESRRTSPGYNVVIIVA